MFPQPEIEYALQHMSIDRERKPGPERRKDGWIWLLALPFLGLCFPALYARAMPVLWGFPFFYWYQFVWVIAASGLLVFVYRKWKT